MQLPIKFNNQPIVLVLLKFLQYLFLFVASVVITNNLTLSGRGEYSYLLGFASICIPVVNLGIGQSLHYHSANNLHQSHVKRILFRHLLLTSLFIILISLYFNFDIYFTLFLIASLIYLNFIKQFIGNGNLYYQSFFEISKPFILIILIIFTGQLSDLRILFAFQIIAMLIAVLLMYKTTLKKEIHTKNVNYKKFYLYGLKAWLADIFNRGISKLDILLIGALLSMDKVAYYSVLFVISESIWMIPDGLAPWLFRRFATIQNNRKIRLNIFQYVIIVSLISGLFGLVLYVILHMGALVYLYGERYSELLPLLKYSILSTLLLVPSKVVSKYLAATNLISTVTAINLMGALVLLITFYMIKANLSLENALFLNMATYSAMSLSSLISIVLWKR